MFRGTLATLGLLLPLTGALAQGSFYRAPSGKWLPLSAKTTGALMQFSLAPEQVGPGGTCLVLDKPKWMVLDDNQPPRATKVLLDGQELSADALQLGRVDKAPAELACALADDLNPLDLPGLRVTLNGQTVAKDRLTVKPLAPDGKSVRVAVKLAGLPPAAYEVALALADRSPARNLLSLKFSYSTAPLLPNGGFESVLPDGKPADWQCTAWSATAQTQFEVTCQPGGVEGQKALQIKGIAGPLNMVCFQDRNDLRPGKYRLSGQYKTAKGAGLSVYYYVEGKEQQTLGQSLPAKPEWTPFAWEFTLPECQHMLLVVRSSNAGETWFDALQLEEVK